MIRIFLTLCWTMMAGLAMAQVSIQPMIEPASFSPQTEIAVTYDVTGTNLEGLAEAYIWVWIPGPNYDAKYNINPASQNVELTQHAKFRKSTSEGKTTFTLTFTPGDFFVQPICAESQLGMLIKGNDWSDGQSVDHLAAMTPLESCFAVKLLAPVQDPVFIDIGGTLALKAESTAESTFTLTIDGSQTDQQTGILNYEFDYTIPQDEGLYPVALEVSNEATGEDTVFTFSYLVNTPSVEMERPAGIIPGINYDESDGTKATLCLLAPGKTAAYILGEFNDFEIAPQNSMFRDGDYFWVEISGLDPGKEYAFQYLVDGVFIADPFADKVLDPDDRYIPEHIYPDLKPYPETALQDEWYKNRLAVLQTAQPAFAWQNSDFEKPAIQDLVIYELLIRDFFAEDGRSYNNLTDTLSYLKHLGVNAIELMPVQEFAGNNSWGYNPTFMFAPDKAYGTKTALKEFIDAAHAEGIAVIMDVVFNHQEIPNPYVALWFDLQTYKVTPDNPMFNVDATHPFSVFYDMNHESELTQFYMDTTLHYWLNEYRIDGFRFDLSKGFTQNNTGGNVSAWGQYDASRIAILKRMADHVRSYAPEAYLILEHFADNKEEKELAEHGFLLWGNMHWDYKDLAIGVKKDISWAYHGTRGWESPRLIAYMESHDEQRIMYELLEYGQSSGLYNVRNFKTALDRVKAAAAFFYAIPGPKMLWQFGELGYDRPLNLCEDGSVNEGCRTSSKPVLWEYYEEENRQKLLKLIQSLINLKINYSVFETGHFSMTTGESFIKELSLVNPNNLSDPANEAEMSVYLVGNFDVQPRVVNAAFPFTGAWYSFFEGGETLELSEPTIDMKLNPGEFKLYVNYEIPFPEPGLAPLITSVESPETERIRIYPNPASDILQVEAPQLKGRSCQVAVYNVLGKRVHSEKIVFNDQPASLSVNRLRPGLYYLTVSENKNLYSIKLIKNQD